MNEDEAWRLALKWRDEWNHRLPNLMIRDVDFIAAKLAPILAERDEARQMVANADAANLAATEKAGLPPGGVDTPDDLAERIAELEAEVERLTTRKFQDFLGLVGRPGGDALDKLRERAEAAEARLDAILSGERDHTKDGGVWLRLPEGEK